MDPDKKNNNLSQQRRDRVCIQLKVVNQTSALMAGFAMVALVEFNIPYADNDNRPPDGLLVTYGLCTTLLVAIHLMSLMIGTCVLPYVQSVNNQMDSPLRYLRWWIMAAWCCSTMIGISLFIIEVILLSWIKFRGSLQVAAYISTGVIILIALVLLAFSIHYRKKLRDHNADRLKSNLKGNTNNSDDSNSQPMLSQ